MVEDDRIVAELLDADPGATGERMVGREDREPRLRAQRLEPEAWSSIGRWTRARSTLPSSTLRVWSCQ